MLIVEILSPSTARRDRGKKRDFYLKLGVPDYWIVDPESQTITSVRQSQPDVVANTKLVWQPAGASAPLAVELATIFSGRKPRTELQ
jgi:Uma2 family endonuclease